MSKKISKKQTKKPTKKQKAAIEAKKGSDNSIPKVRPIKKTSKKNAPNIIVDTPIKIAVYAISKNEEKFIERFCSSCIDADMVAVGDTGSTDNTVKLLKECGATVGDVKVTWDDWPDVTRTKEWMERLGKPWRFDVARNRSLDIVPKDFDICICLDLDEIMVDGWRQHIEKSFRDGYNRFRYHYTWSWKVEGKVPDIIYWADKIHTRNEFKWVHPVHEVMSYIGPKREVQGWCDCKIEHYPDHTKSRSQYFPLLEASILEDPEDDRKAYYLGREYFFYGHYKKCISECKRHLSLPRAKWDAERSCSMRYIAKSYGALGNNKEEHAYFRRAVAETPHEREPWVELAGYCWKHSLFLEGYFAAIQALQIKERPRHYTTEAFAWDHTPHDYACLCGSRIGLVNEARKHAINAWRITPNDPRLAENVKFMYRKMTTDAVVKMDPRIYLLWPTIRPKMFADSFRKWLDSVENKERIECVVAVNTVEQEKEIRDFGLPINKILVVGDERKGVTHACYQLTSSLDFLPGEIVVLASDDFVPCIDKWDRWAIDQFEDFNGCLMINDGHQQSGCITLPIMDSCCLLRLNRIIYHPAYVHQYSDNELYDNLNELGLVKDLRSEDVHFEHVHWHNSKREKDEVDEVILKATGGDQGIYESRKKLPIKERLTV